MSSWRSESIPIPPFSPPSTRPSYARFRIAIPSAWLAYGKTSRPSALLARESLGYSARLTTVGLGLGIVAAKAATRLLSVMLYGVSPLDVRTFLMVTLILAAVAILASYLPTRRAAAVDPMVALRNE